jgi:hypothetical protein
VTHGATATADLAKQARPLVHIELRRQRVGAETQFPGEAREPGPGDRARQRARHGRARALERGSDEFRVVPPRRRVHQRGIAARDDEHRAVHPWPRAERRRRDPHPRAELEPRFPARVEQRPPSSRPSLTRHLGLDDHVRAGQALFIQQAAQDLRGDPEWDVGYHAKRLGRQWHRQHVGLYHGDRRPGSELGAQPLGQRRVALDRLDPGAPARQRGADQAVSRADVEHEVTVSDPGTVHERVDRAAVDEEVLA